MDTDSMPGSGSGGDEDGDTSKFTGKSGRSDLVYGDYGRFGGCVGTREDTLYKAFAFTTVAGYKPWVEGTLS